MAVEHRGGLLANGMRFAIVVSRTNEVITERLCAGAVDGLTRHGADTDAIEMANLVAGDAPATATSRPARRGSRAGSGSPRRRRGV